MTRFSEVVREWMGWCPDRRMAHLIAKDCRSPEMTILAGLPKKESYVNDGVIVDYGKTGITLPFFIGSLIGIAGVLAFLFLIKGILFFLQFRLFFLGFALLVAIVIFLRNLKRDRLEITQNALIITSFLHRPVIIQKDMISSVEIRDNVPPLPLWLQKVVILLIIPVSSAGIIYGKYLEYSIGEIASSSFFLDLGYYIMLVSFFLAIYYHSRIRSDYPGILVITTNTQKLAGVYGDNLKEIAGLLERSV